MELHVTVTLSVMAKQECTVNITRTVAQVVTVVTMECVSVRKVQLMNMATTHAVQVTRLIHFQHKV